MREKVVVAMSGGVDSAVAAAILKREGYEVIGVTMQIWLPETTGDASAACCGGQSEIDDARKVAQALGIPHYVMDFRDLFRETVITDFCNEYSNGRTPNPCIRCNEYVKFGALLDEAKKLGARYVATGHHARIEWDEQGRCYLLKKGMDRKKDQTYVLYRLTQQQMKQTLLPIGHLEKERVREIARELNLPVAAKPESQDICFIPDNNYPGFLSKHASMVIKPGPIIDIRGGTIGEHKGSQFYTIGQRRRLGIAGQKPLFVTAILPERNAVVVGEEHDLFRSVLIASNLNWISGAPPSATGAIKAKIRYTHHEADVAFSSLGEGKFLVTFGEPQKAITPGQSVVFYSGDSTLGGGIIERAQ